MSLEMTRKSDRVAGVKKRIQVRIEEDRRDVGTVEDVAQIVGDRALPPQRILELAVERGQIFVDGLQFLSRGYQFLLRRLDLLVERKRFPVHAGGAPPAAVRGPGFGFADPRRVMIRYVNEANQQQVFAFAGNQLYVDAERDPVAVAGRLPLGHGDARVFAIDPRDRRPQPRPRGAPRHRE